MSQFQKLRFGFKKNYKFELEEQKLVAFEDGISIG